MTDRVKFTSDHSRFTLDAPKLAFDHKSKPVSQYSPVFKTLAGDLLFLCERLEQHQIIYVTNMCPRHIIALSSLFPDTKINLYHPKPGLAKTLPNVNHMGEKFSDEAAEYWFTRTSEIDIVFICDARVIEDVGEQEVIESMEAQKNWIRIMNPQNFSVTFRAPYTQTAGSFPYLSGQLSILPFAKCKSPELRLTGSIRDARANCVLYDTEKIRQVMYYHNSVVRPQKDIFAGDYKDKLFDHGYDSASFLYSVGRYLQKVAPKKKPYSDAVVLAFAKTLTPYW